MSARYSRLAVNAQAEAIAKLLDGGYIDIMTGDRPESEDDPVADDQVLSRNEFSAKAFGPPKDGVLQANPIAKSVAIRNGEPTWCRCFTKDGRPVVDGNYGSTGANLAGKVNMLVQGQIVNITGFKHIVSKQGI